MSNPYGVPEITVQDLVRPDPDHGLPPPDNNLGVMPLSFGCAARAIREGEGSQEVGILESPFQVVIVHHRPSGSELTHERSESIPLNGRRSLGDR
jgi:hypothetical protein